MAIQHAHLRRLELHAVVAFLACVEAAESAVRAHLEEHAAHGCRRFWRTAQTDSREARGRSEIPFPNESSCSRNFHYCCERWLFGRVRSERC